MSAFQRPAVNWLEVTIQWPSGLIAAGVDGEEVADEDVAAGVRCAVLQMRPVWSALTVTSSRPFGEYSASLTSERWPFSVWRSFPVEASHSWANVALRRRDAEAARREDGVRRRDVGSC